MLKNVEHLGSRRLPVVFGAIVAVALASVCLAAGLLAAAPVFAPAPAFADTKEIDAVPSEIQQRVEDATAAYAEATAKVEEAEKLVADNEAHLAELSAQLPVQREKSETAIRELYKMQKGGFALISAVIESEDFGEFIDTLTYLTYIQNKNIAEVVHLTKMQEELEEIRSTLVQQRDEALADQQEAEKALEEAKEARQQAIEAARKAAEEAEAKAKAEREKAAQQQASGGSNGTGSSDSASETTVQPPSAVGTGDEDRDAFIAEWAPRIDAYMEGYPLAGYGSVFAAAAWDYCVDPRFSPAISCVESTKGMYCFRNHNAWGWGSVDWDSWEEAITAHVRGLARGYGYTVTEEGAKKYCPPTWQHWYNRVVEEMNKI